MISARKCGAMRHDTGILDSPLRYHTVHFVRELWDLVTSAMVQASRRKGLGVRRATSHLSPVCPGATTSSCWHPVIAMALLLSGGARWVLQPYRCVSALP